MNLGQSSTSSTCNVSRMQNPSVSCCGGGGCISMVVAHLLLWGEMCVENCEEQRKKILGLPKLL